MGRWGSGALGELRARFVTCVNSRIHAARGAPGTQPARPQPSAKVANGGAIVVNGGSTAAKTPPKLSGRSPTVVAGRQDPAKPRPNVAKPRPSPEKPPRTAAKPPQTPVNPPRNVVKVRCIAAEIVLRDFLAFLWPAFKFLRGLDEF